MKTCIINGTILTENSEYKGDVLIEDGCIVSVGKNIKFSSDEYIDASGMYVFAGGVDEHTHYGSFNSLSFETSLAAIAGGTTTIVDFVPQEKGENLIEALNKHQNKARNNLWANVAFHSMIMDLSKVSIEEIETLPSLGVNSIKMFMAYKGTPYYADDSMILKVMQKIQNSGITLMLHAENPDMIEAKTEYLLRHNKIDPIYHAKARTTTSEAEAVYKGICFAKEMNVPLFFVHISSKKALSLIIEAQLNGIPVYCETCTHYLTLHEDKLALPNLKGCDYICSPPLRTQEDSDYLWKGIQDGRILAVSSDHCAVKGGSNKKRENFIDFSKVSNGLPGVQYRLHLLWTEGVCKKRITKQDFIKMFTSSPARICGLKKKGQIYPGCDADIVVFDPNFHRILKDKDSLEGCGYCAFEGMELAGKVKYVFVNGKLVVKDEKPLSKNGKIEKTSSYGICWDKMQLIQ